MKIRTWCLSVLFVLLSTIPAFSNNLLQNPGFEDVNAFPTTWNSIGIGFRLQTRVIREGLNAAYQSVPTGGTTAQDYFSSIEQTFPVQGGQTIYATVQSRMSSIPEAFARAGLQLVFTESDGAVVSTVQEVIGGATTWRELYVKGVAPQFAKKVTYRLFLYAPQPELGKNGISMGVSAYFDKAVLSTDPLPAPVRTNLINANFENGLHDWLVFYQPALAVEKTEVVEGTRSAKQAVTAISGQDFFSALYQDLTYTSGNISASVQAKAALNPSSPAIAALKLEFYKSTDATPPNLLGSREDKLTGTTGWKRLLINNVTPPAGTKMIRYYLLTYAPQYDPITNKGNAYFDDAIFTIGALPSNQLNAQLTNGSFESGLTGWADTYGVPAAVITASPYVGTFAVQKKIQFISDQDYFTRLAQNIYYNTSGNPYPDNTFVNATIVVKTAMNPLTKSAAGIQMEFFDANHVRLHHNDKAYVPKSLIGGNTPYKYLYIEGLTPPGTVYVRLAGIVFARVSESYLGGTAVFDDVKFSRTQLAKPALRTTLENADFENGLNSWTDDGHPAEINNSVKQSGTYAPYFHIDESVFTSEYYGAFFQDVDVTGKTKVGAVSVWINTGNMSKLVAAGIQIEFFNSNGTRINGPIPKVFNGPTGWIKLVINNQSIPVGTKTLRVTCFIYSPKSTQTGNTVVYFDNVGLALQ